MGMLKEFKDFAVKGNMIDMAVGIVVGGAFGKVVSSLVTDVIMPPIGMMTAGTDFTKMAYTLQEADKEAGKEAVLLSYGKFIQVTLDFIIVAFAIFVVVKMINSMKKKEEAKPSAPPAQEVLLGEIRDLLAKQDGK